MSQNLPEKLARELVRVTAIRERYHEIGAHSGANSVVVAPQIMMMDQVIEQGCKAAGSPDIEGQIRAIQALEEWQE